MPKVYESNNRFAQWKKSDAAKLLSVRQNNSGRVLDNGNSNSNIHALHLKEKN